jgi:hypothetical protein
VNAVKRCHGFDASQGPHCPLCARPLLPLSSAQKSSSADAGKVARTIAARAELAAYAATIPPCGNCGWGHCYCGDKAADEGNNEGGSHGTPSGYI